MENLHGWARYALQMVAILVILMVVNPHDPITAAELVDKLMEHWLMDEAIQAIAGIVTTLIEKW